VSVFVFVYGTLRSQGEPRGEGIRSVGSAYVNGFTMYCLGGFPGVVEGEDQITGEVLEVSEQHFNSFDRYEGYNPKEPEKGLYNRRKVSARLTNGETVEAWIYTFNNNQQREYPVVESGDWFVYRNIDSGEE